jgi:small GTP-binding protein
MPGTGLTRYSVTSDGRQVKLNICDTAGQEKYQSLTGVYFRDAQCVLICYDLADRKTFDGIPVYLKELEPGSYSPTVIANKCDLDDRREVTEEEDRAFAAAIEGEYREVSALSGEGVAPLFQDVAERFAGFAGVRRAPELRHRKGTSGGAVEEGNGGSVCVCSCCQ